jgi:hypothetical protein
MPIKEKSYVQTMIDIKEQLSLKYFYDPEQLRKDLANIRKKYGLIPGDKKIGFIQYC